jgi:hypothetical protein
MRPVQARRWRAVRRLPRDDDPDSPTIRGG